MQVGENGHAKATTLVGPRRHADVIRTELEARRLEPESPDTCRDTDECELEQVATHKGSQVLLITITARAAISGSASDASP
jgi:hypothetical protein